jgi:hypothetical protein
MMLLNNPIYKSNEINSTQLKVIKFSQLNESMSFEVTDEFEMDDEPETDDGSDEEPEDILGLDEEPEDTLGLTN